MSERSIVRTEAAPSPVGGAPYSQAIRAAGLVFVAGQVGLRPGETEIVSGGIGPQTAQAMENIKGVLEAAGSGLDRLVKTTVFLTDFANFAEMNETYARYVGDAPPARSTVEISALPMGALIEIEAIGIIP